MKTKNKFYDTIFEEQESIINIDYSGKHLDIYTSRKAVYERLKKKLGDPTRVYNIENYINGAVWEIPFDNKKRITSVLSRPLLIGNIK